MNWLIALVVSSAAGFGIGWMVKGWEVDSAEKKALEVVTQQIDTRAVNHEQFKAKERVRYVTIEKEVEKIVDRPIYVTTQCFDDDGVRLLNEAITGAAPSQSASGVPSASDARQRPE